MISKKKKEKKINQTSPQLFSEAWTPNDIVYYGPNSRKVSLYTPIMSETSLPLISQLKELNSRSNESIILEINTEGGSVTDSFAIYDCIKRLKCPVIAYTTGLCSSGGLVVLSACDYRISSPNCMFFYHQPIMTPPTQVFNSSESTESLEKSYSIFKRMYDRCIINRTKISRTDWEQNFKDRTSKYFNANDALKYGFIDSIDKNRSKNLSIAVK